jgi:hypothetical protein
MVAADVTGSDDDALAVRCAEIARDVRLLEDHGGSLATRLLLVREIDRLKYEADLVKSWDLVL